MGQGECERCLECPTADSSFSKFKKECFSALFRILTEQIARDYLKALVDRNLQPPENIGIAKLARRLETSYKPVDFTKIAVACESRSYLCFNVSAFAKSISTIHETLTLSFIIKHALILDSAITPAPMIPILNK
jgi:hypothetical protein